MLQATHRLHAHSAPASVHSSVDSRANLKTLIIEDDSDVLDIVSVCLEMRWPDGVILDAPGGAAGLETFRRENPDIVILDLGLPDMDGLEVCRKLRQESGVPIVILTARGQPAEIIRGLDAGADDYITKPFNYLELLARVETILRKSRLEGVAGKAVQFEAPGHALHSVD